MIITAAETWANVGTEVPPMERIPAPLRKLARLAGKAIILASSFITARQRNFNMHILSALKLVTDSVERAIHAQTEGLLQEMEAVRKSMSDELAYLKTSMVLLERRMAILLEEAGKRLPAPFDKEQLEKISDEGRNSLDALYVAFEERFQGSREQIMEQLRVYLPYVRQAGEHTAGGMVLDIGCGRGIWLELLYREGIRAKGVDTNRLMVAKCREHRLDVVHEDALAYMRSLPDAAIDVVTGFHIIERLPFEMLIKIMDEAIRVLRPGGMVIFETLNPQNVLVGSFNFYLDPTFRKPLPSQAMKFIVESRGFVNVEILDLNPSTATVIAEETDVARRFNDYFYGAMAYAVIGRKG